MDEKAAPTIKQRLNSYGRLMRRERILVRLREGWAYDEIARAEGLSAERVRQIVSGVLQKRVVDDETDHAKLQLARLAPAMHLVANAILKGDVAAVSPLLKLLDRLDRYQKAAKVNQTYDDDAREKLLDKINRIADNLRADDARKAEKASEAAEAAEASDGGEPAEAGAAGENFSLQSA
jgi:DNA-binding CsgD family transcriptional regulator